MVLFFHNPEAKQISNNFVKISGTGRKLLHQYSTLCKVFQKEHNNQLAQIISLVQQITQILKASSYVGTPFFIRTISQVNGGLNSSKNKNNLTKNWDLSQEIIPSMIFSQNIGNDHGHGVT